MVLRCLNNFLLDPPFKYGAPFPGLCDSLSYKCIQWKYYGNGGSEGQKSCHMDITVYTPEVSSGVCMCVYVCVCVCVCVCVYACVCVYVIVKCVYNFMERDKSSGMFVHW